MQDVMSLMDNALFPALLLSRRKIVELYLCGYSRFCDIGL